MMCMAIQSDDEVAEDDEQAGDDERDQGEGNEQRRRGTRRCQKVQQSGGRLWARRKPSMRVAMTLEAPVRLTQDGDDEGAGGFGVVVGGGEVASRSGVTSEGRMRSKKRASWKRSGAVSGRGR